MAQALTVQKMFASIAPRYDLANSVLSFGIHHIWRYTLTHMLPASKDKLVLDLCTGTGDLLPLLRKRFGTVIGADFCLPMLENAEKKFPNNEYRLIQADALNMPFPDASFDIVSVAFGVRNFEQLEKGLLEISRILKPDGKLLVLEFGQPQNKIFAALYNFYSKHLMPLIGGLISGNKEAYQYLPQTAASFPCAGAFESILKTCGFSGAKTRPLTFGIAYAYLADKGSNAKN